MRAARTGNSGERHQHKFVVQLQLDANRSSSIDARTLVAPSALFCDGRNAQMDVLRGPRDSGVAAGG